MSNKKNTVDNIEALLPQTQCGLCDYGGCRPYAEAMANGEANINRCPPGGIDTLKQLGNLLAIDPEPYIPDMAQKQKPPMTAIVNEDLCIGCTKCIQACPVDAIIGAAKQMHVIIQGECTGCELCIEPCPMDCIDLKELTAPNYDRKRAHERHQQREQRLASRQDSKRKTYLDNKPNKQHDINDKQAAIAAAVARVKAKRKTWTSQ